MGKLSRNKGKVGEREARDGCREHLNAPEAIRAGQANGSYSADVLFALPKGHVECKRYKGIAALRFLEQAQADATPTEYPFVLMRDDGKKRWVAMLYLDDVQKFVEDVNANNRGDYPRAKGVR